MERRLLGSKTKDEVGKRNSIDWPGQVAHGIEHDKG